MSIAQQQGRQNVGGRPKRGDRRSLYVRVVPSIWNAFAREAAAANVSQVDLIWDILNERYCIPGGCGTLKKWPGYPGESRRARVALVVKIPSHLREAFTREAELRGVTQSDHMEDLLAERYKLDQVTSEAGDQPVLKSDNPEDVLPMRYPREDKRGVVHRRSA